MPNTSIKEFPRESQGAIDCADKNFMPVAQELPKWRETQGGWTITVADGVTANIQITKRQGVRWTLFLSGACETIVEAQTKLEVLAGVIMDA